MATNCFSRDEDPKFMKIVLNPDEHRLKIPTEFVKRYGNSLPNVISLKVPTGSLWRVGLTHTDGEIWMQKGLKEFKEHYSIGFGHSLVFKYQGNDQFVVIVFDRTSSEIEYPCKPANSNCGAVSESTDDSVSSEEVPMSKKCGGKEKIQELAGRHDENESDASVEIIDSPSVSNRERRKRLSGAEDHPMTTKTSPGKWSGKKSLQKERSVTYKRAKCYKDDNPSTNPYFISLMHPSHVIRGCEMSIPMHIAKGNLSGKTSDLKLRVLGGKTWPVKCTVRKLNAKIHGGWRNFVKDNSLKVGDVCIFEVDYKTTDLILDVIIFRN